MKGYRRFTDLELSCDFSRAYYMPKKVDSTLLKACVSTKVILENFEVQRVREKKIMWFESRVVVKCLLDSSCLVIDYFIFFRVFVYRVTFSIFLIHFLIGQHFRG